MLEPAEVKRWERLTAAMLRHAAEDDPEALAQVVKVLEDARGKLPEVVNQLRQYGGESYGRTTGYSWAEIAAPLGITRQSAQQRFGR